jgi:hypothetical protein
MVMGRLGDAVVIEEAPQPLLFGPLGRIQGHGMDRAMRPSWAATHCDTATTMRARVSS